LQNKESAVKVLYARLLEQERLKKEEEKAKLKGARIDAGWGNQIRSYVLHPYKMVKDHRTGYEVGNTGAVLDGDLDRFMESFLRSKVGEK
jgi:peptide chain release factor 2